MFLSRNAENIMDKAYILRSLKEYINIQKTVEISVRPSGKEIWRFMIGHINEEGENIEEAKNSE